jgi:radical SAM protein with 4Fe4S-binding SPASM domain
LIDDAFIENPPFPSFIQFETSTACNAHCMMCPHDQMKRHGVASWTTLNKVIREAITQASEACPFLMQEPMLEPRLFSVLANIKQNNPVCAVTIYSNMGKLHPDIERIIEHGLLDELHISFYGPTKELYAKYQSGLDWETTKANIRTVKALKEKHHKTTPRTNLHILAVPDIIQAISSYDVTHDVNAASFVPFDTFHGTISDLGADMKEFCGVPAERTPCQRLWTGLNVHFDGTVVPCCIDYDEMMHFGNINEESLEDIWKGKRFQNMRNMHILRMWDKLPLCKDCKVHEYNFSQEWRDYWKTKC